MTDESFFHLKDYRAVVCKSGKATLDSESVAMLSSFIRSRGRLLLSGAETAWRLFDTWVIDTYPDAGFFAKNLHTS